MNSYLDSVLMMRHELSLVFILMGVFVADLFVSEADRPRIHPLACGLLFVHTLWMICFPGSSGTAFGGMYATGTMIVFVKGILNAGTLLMFLQADSFLAKPGVSIRRGEFYVISLFTLLGMYLMVSAEHFLLFYIGMETASIPLATLVAIEKHNLSSVEASAKYILSTAFASGVMLFGLSFLYGASGTLYYGDMMPFLLHSPALLFGMVLFLTGIFFKISLAPFHLWTADVYEGSSVPVMGYLSGVSKAAAVFALFVVLGRVFSGLIEEWQSLLWWIILITITLGNLFAIRQKNLKRFFAFSSISQAGYVLLGILAGTPEGIQASLFFLLVYLFSNFAAFGVLAAVQAKAGKIGMEDYNGFYQTHPRMTWVMTLALFSLAGIPPTAGFFSKFFIFMSAAAQGYYGLVILALLNTILSLYYYLLIVKAMFLNHSDNPIPFFKTDLWNRISQWVCVAGILLLGLVPFIYQYIGSLT